LDAQAALTADARRCPKTCRSFRPIVDQLPQLDVRGSTPVAGSLRSHPTKKLAFAPVESSRGAGA
jgi:hypothetical protein